MSGTARSTSSSSREDRLHVRSMGGLRAMADRRSGADGAHQPLAPRMLSASVYRNWQARALEAQSGGLVVATHQSRAPIGVPGERVGRGASAGSAELPVPLLSAAPEFVPRWRRRRFKDPWRQSGRSSSREETPP